MTKSNFMNHTPTILIVEDEAAILYAMQAKLRVAGFQVVTADDGEKAWRFLETMLPDLIVLDVVLPKIDGLELLKRIKNDERLQHLPTVIVTNLTDDETRKRGLELGANDFIIKVEYNLDEIALRIQKLLEK